MSVELPIKYALPGEEQRKEMAVITACWDQMSKLDSHARFRVLDWLRAWARTEASKDICDDEGF
jgi:hypothetical protein